MQCNLCNATYAMKLMKCNEFNLILSKVYSVQKLLIAIAAGHNLAIFLLQFAKYDLKSIHLMDVVIYCNT